jgi:WhiB family transcriptional regulator, redox-sensing transcriptional regulator
MNEKFDPFDVEMAPTMSEHHEIVKNEEARHLRQKDSAVEVAGGVSVQRTVSVDILDMAKPEEDSPTAWMARGKCREYPPSTFFPDNGSGVEAAIRICEGCPVKAPCLEYALLNRIEHGVWGGASERQRRRLIRQRRLDGVPIANKPRSYTSRKK